MIPLLIPTVNTFLNQICVRRKTRFPGLPMERVIVLQLLLTFVVNIAELWSYSGFKESPMQEYEEMSSQENVVAPIVFTRVHTTGMVLQQTESQKKRVVFLVGLVGGAILVGLQFAWTYIFVGKFGYYMVEHIYYRHIYFFVNNMLLYKIIYSLPIYAVFLLLSAPVIWYLT